MLGFEEAGNTPVGVIRGEESAEKGRF